MRVDAFAIWNRCGHPTLCELLLEELSVKKIPGVDQTIGVDGQIDEKVAAIVDERGENNTLDFHHPLDRPSNPGHSIAIQPKHIVLLLDLPCERPANLLRRSRRLGVIQRPCEYCR